MFDIQVAIYQYMPFCDCSIPNKLRRLWLPQQYKAISRAFLNTLALTFISFLGRFVFAVQKHYLFFASNPLV